MEVLRAADDLRGDADHDAVPRDLLPLRDDGARSEDRPAPDLRPAPDDAPHPDDTLVADLASVDDRAVAHGHAVPDLHGVPEVDVDDRVVLDARALADPDPIQVSSQDRAVPDARVLPDCDVARDHGGLGDIDHRCRQGCHGLKAFGARVLPAVERPRLLSGRWSHSRPRLTLPILSSEGGLSSGHRMLILDRQGFNTGRTGCLSHPWRAASRNGTMVSSTSLR